MTVIAYQPAPRTRLRLTVRGRRVLSALVGMPLALAIVVPVVGLALDGGAAVASRAAGAPAGTFAEVTVMTGESLWSIAEEIAPGSDPRDVVDDIVRLNGLESVVVSAGQRLALPAAYSSPVD